MASKKYEALVAELDALWATVNVESCIENMADRGIHEPVQPTDAEAMEWVKIVRAEIAMTYGV